MSFIKIEPIRAIKLYDKTYRSAKQAATAYAFAAVSQHTYNRRNTNCFSSMTRQDQIEYNKKLFEKFYRRSKPIFDRYFAGEKK